MSLIHPARTASIRGRAQAPGYAARALEAVTLIQQASGPPQVLDCLVRATAAIGASASVYTAAIPEDGEDPSCFSLFACHPALAKAYGSKPLVLSHPWFRFVQTHTMPGTDHQIHLQHESDAAAVQLAGQHGFRSCLVVPGSIGTRSGRLEMLCIGSDQADDFEGPEARAVRTLARALAAELHDWLSRHLTERLRSAAHLQAIDIDLLALEWQGLGTKEIAMRTGMSPSSVDSRFQRLNVRLRCANRKHAARPLHNFGQSQPWGGDLARIAQYERIGSIAGVLKPVKRRLPANSALRTDYCLQALAAA